MQHKKGVSLKNLSSETWFMIGHVDAIFFEYTGRQCVVTAGNRPKHPNKNSLHRPRVSRGGKANAVDFRIRHLNMETRKRILMRLKQRLGRRGFDFELKSDHIHGEYDPRPREVFMFEVN